MAHIFIAIQQIQKNFFQNNQYSQMFNGFITSLLFEVQNCLIAQCRKIIIRNLYSSKNDDYNIITDYQVYSFGGASISSIFKHYYYTNCSNQLQKEMLLSLVENKSDYKQKCLCFTK